ncbi:MAG: hypothetical protein KC478_05030 [Bacteriovoracaceae bacterium]|nr:hypothetical protein [Bacteriovoracaceae bacterium]
MGPNVSLLRIGTLVVSAIIFLTSCMNQPIRRRGTSYAPRGQYGHEQNSPEFYPIKKKVALLPFYNESPFGKEDLAITATEEFRRELGRMRDFVVDPQAQGLFGTSKEIYAGGGMKLVQLTRKAKLSGVNLVIYGRITHAKVRQKTDEIGMVRKTKSYAESVVEVRVFDVHANKEIFSEKMDGNINDSAHKFFLSERDATLDYRRNLLRYSVRVAVRRFLPRVNKLGAKLDWVGRVAKIIGSKIYVNAGRKSGITVGDILKVMTEGTEIFDPESGALIGISKGEVKGTLEIIDFFGPDGAVAILHSGGSVTEGDFVQLY